MKEVFQNKLINSQCLIDGIEPPHRTYPRWTTFCISSIRLLVANSSFRRLHQGATLDFLANSLFVASLQAMDNSVSVMFNLLAEAVGRLPLRVQLVLAEDCYYPPMDNKMLRSQSFSTLRNKLYSKGLLSVPFTNLFFTPYKSTLRFFSLLYSPTEEICKAPVEDSNPFPNQPPTSAIGRLLCINLNYAN